MMMYTFYLLILSMLIVAIGLFIFPLNRNVVNVKSFLAISVFISVTSLSLYYLLGNYLGLENWYKAGKQHYYLQEQVSELGGIEGIIQKIKHKIKLNPTDPEGWFILGKLYLTQHKIVDAKNALTMAHQLEPKNAQINYFYGLALKEYRKV